MNKEYKEEGIELYLGDCMELLKDIPSNSVDLVLVDPPYGTIKGLVFENNVNYAEGKMDWDEVLPLGELFKEYRRILRVRGHLIMFSQGKNTQDVRNQSNGSLEYRIPLYWEKDNFANFLSVKTAPVSYVEDLSVFNKVYPDSHDEDIELKGYATKVTDFIGKNGNQIKQEKGDQTLVHFFGKGIQFRLPFEENYQWLIDTYGIDKMEGYLTYKEMEEKKEKTDYKRTYNIDKGNFNSNLLKYRKGSGNFYHPTEKPVGLLSHLIRVYSNEGDLVLDNTMGSGSTGVAAKQEGRRFIGMELDEGFYNTSIKRIKEAERKK